LGAVALILFLVETIERGYGLVLPGVSLGVVCILIFSRKTGAVTALTELVESSGMILVVWLLALGWELPLSI